MVKKVTIEELKETTKQKTKETGKCRWCDFTKSNNGQIRVHEETVHKELWAVHGKRKMGRTRFWDNSFTSADRKKICKDLGITSIERFSMGVPDAPVGFTVGLG